MLAKFRIYGYTYCEGKKETISAMVTPPNTNFSDEVVLTFDNNKLIGQLFGQFDQHLAMLEKQLGVEAIASGNYVRLKGAPANTEKARFVLLEGWKRLKDHKTLSSEDIEGMIRIVKNQGELLKIRNYK